MNWLIASLVLTSLGIEPTYHSLQVHLEDLQEQSPHTLETPSTSTLISQSSTLQNWYKSYQKPAKNIYRGVMNDQIKMGYSSPKSSLSRQGLCEYLVKQHNKVHRYFFALDLKTDDCLEALENPHSYHSSADWQVWSGYHEGHWFNHNHDVFEDNAWWIEPESQTTPNPTKDIDLKGEPRVYAFQAVEFQGAQRSPATRYGWNLSSADMSYVLGFDRKTDDMGMDVATHIGFPFNPDNASCLVWFTPQEAFLECIRDVPLQIEEGKAEHQRRRTSTGLYGYGQWDVVLQ